MRPAPGTASGARSPTFTTVGSAASWLRTSLEDLQVGSDRMRRNLGDAADTGAAATLVDRALENR